MGKASRDKGKVGERAWAAFLRDVGGFDDARRGVQYSGLGNAPDCVVPCLGEAFRRHFPICFCTTYVNVGVSKNVCSQMFTFFVSLAVCDP